MILFPSKGFLLLCTYCIHALGCMALAPLPAACCYPVVLIPSLALKKLHRLQQRELFFLWGCVKD